MTEVTDEQIREHFYSASANELETEVRTCIIRAAVRLNNILPDCEAKGGVMRALDDALDAGRDALCPDTKDIRESDAPQRETVPTEQPPQPDVKQPDTMTDPPEADAPTEPGPPTI